MKLPLEKRKIKVVEIDEIDEDVILDSEDCFDPDEEMSDEWKEALQDLKDLGFM
jgi:hypothetical protein